MKKGSWDQLNMHLCHSPCDLGQWPPHSKPLSAPLCTWSQLPPSASQRVKGLLLPTAPNPGRSSENICSMDMTGTQSNRNWRQKHSAPLPAAHLRTTAQPSGVHSTLAPCPSPPWLRQLPGLGLPPSFSRPPWAAKLAFQVQLWSPLLLQEACPTLLSSFSGFPRALHVLHYSTCAKRDCHLCGCHTHLSFPLCQVLC